MRSRLRRRAWSLFAVLFLVSTGSFLLTNLLPGDASIAILGPAANEQSIREVRRDLGLDEPIPVRYVRWLGRVVQGDLGVSYRDGQPVAELLRSSLTVTLELLFFAEMIALIVGVPVGVWAAHRAGRRFDKWASAVAFGALAIPQFAVALLLLSVFAVRLRWFPAVGFVQLRDNPLENLRSMVLPSLTLGVPLGALYARLVRTDMVVTLGQDHIQMARAMGLPAKRILLRHALRQSSLTLLTIVGLQIGALLGGSLLIERIFALPGMGRLMIERTVTRDYLVVQGGVLVIAAGYVIANFIVDVLHSALDPRIRHEQVSQ